MSSDDPIIISAAVTGGFTLDDRHRNVPATPEEIGQAAVDAARAGAAIVHLHARNDQGAPAWEPEFFERALDVLRDSDTEVIVNLTTSWGGTSHGTPDERRLAPLTLGIDIGSFDCGSTNFGDKVFYNSVPFLRVLAAAMKDAGVKPEIEIFDAGMIRTAERLRQEGLLDGPLFFQFVLGIAGGAPATARELLHLIDSLPPDSVWSVCAVGRAQLPMNILGSALGGHVRTGLEDNLFLTKGARASNAELVARLHSVVELLGRRPATPAEARSILGLPSRGPKAS